MPRQKNSYDRSDLTTTGELRAFIDLLDKIKSTVTEAIAAILEAENKGQAIPGLIHRKRSALEMASQKLRSLDGGISEGTYDLRSGRPQTIGELTSRRRDKADAIIDAQRARHYAIVAENKPELPKKAPTKKKGN
ncbi:MAG: hypothetical protein SGI77_24990 [Pirellulaceae bacterium]|nr:hypothetical protein [Pirellulaceae bacterium]